MDEIDSSQKAIVLTIRPSRGSTFTTAISTSSTVRQLKEKLATPELPVASIRLVYSGRVLKDEDQLSAYSIQEGHTIHMVKRATNRATEQAAQTARPPNSSAGPGFDEQSFMAAILENPAIRDMMSNPEMVRRMMMANPHTREVMENNPEVAQMLNDPSFLRQSLDMARNPKLMKQALRNNDRALSNLEMVPGGFNHLRRMYHSVQEPMEASRSVPDPSTDDLNEQFAARLNADTRPHAGQLNTTALPNPWAPPPRPQHTPSRFPLFPGMPGLSANSPGSIGSGFNPFASPFANSEGHGTSTGSGTGTQQGNNNSSSNSSNNNANALNSPLGALLGQRMGGLGGGPQPSPFGFPMGEAFPPMGNNPEMFQQVLQFNQMMRQMQQQQQPPSHHPMAGGFPAFANMFRGVPLVPETSRSSIIDTVNPSNIIINPTSGNGTTSATTSDTSAASANSETSVASESSIQSLEQRYESQLASLRDMGFRDDSRNMRALLASGGDVSSAIEYLLLEGRM